MIDASFPVSLILLPFWAIKSFWLGWNVSGPAETRAAKID